MCQNAYASAYKKGTKGHLVSPGLAPDEILKQFPKTKIMVGTNDPMRDSCL